jgi:hypothetical protein
MGTDYTGNDGIGVRVSLGDTYNEDEDDYTDTSEVLDDLLQGTSYHYFEIGHYDTEKDFYVCIDSPFEHGYDITQKRNELLKFLEDNNIEYYGDVDEVGGLNVW